MRKYFGSVCLSFTLLFIVLVFFSGCETLKGTAKGFKEGFQKDWNSISQWDSGFREVLW